MRVFFYDITILQPAYGAKSVIIMLLRYLPEGSNRRSKESFGIRLARVITPLSRNTLQRNNCNH